MPSAEFQRTIRDLNQFGETIKICCTKGGAMFSTSGEVATANVRLGDCANVDVKDEVNIEMIDGDPLTLSFAGKYLAMFSKYVKQSKYQNHISMCPLSLGPPVSPQGSRSLSALKSLSWRSSTWKTTSGASSSSSPQRSRTMTSKIEQ